ncbi:MAG: DNA polymerase III subunit epsilon [Pseudomonadota bacterium]
MREIVLDTETTGLDPEQGHRVVEIACLELVNHLPTGNSFQRYVNPRRDMPEAAAAIHGLSAAFLADQPSFAEVAGEFLAFTGDSRLVIHNAEFDLNFINAELAKAGFAPLDPARVIDTVQLARRKFPGAPASLDALCARFNIDASARRWHGALIDAQLLAAIYLELVGGRQAAMDLAARPAAADRLAIGAGLPRPPRAHAVSAEERAAHAGLVAKLKDPIWTS